MFTTILLIEGTHYERRLEQPLPVPKPLKHCVKCLLCGDPTLDADEGHDARKRGTSKGRNIRFDWLMTEWKSDHPKEFRDRSRNLFAMSFTRNVLGVAPLVVFATTD
jgi:hypothetical protein